MDVKHAVSDIRTALDERLLPTITVWNRLEGRPRRADFDRALKAEVRDALWMLTKQWQIGEFEAEDAGSPVSTKVRMRTAPLTKYEPAGSAAEAFTEDVPLEAKVERRTLRWVVDGHRVKPFIPKPNVSMPCVSNWVTLIVADLAASCALENA